MTLLALIPVSSKGKILALMGANRTFTLRSYLAGAPPKQHSTRAASVHWDAGCNI